MMRSMAGLVGLLCCAAVLACGRASTGREDAGGRTPVTTVAVTDDLRAAGCTAYRKYCIQCHGYNGRGDGPSAASLDPPPRDHTDAEVMDAISDRAIADTVRDGGVARGFPGMPAFPNVPEEEIVALVAYVRSLSRPDVAHIDLEGF